MAWKLELDNKSGSFWKIIREFRFVDENNSGKKKLLRGPMGAHGAPRAPHIFLAYSLLGSIGAYQPCLVSQSENREQESEKEESSAAEK